MDEKLFEITYRIKHLSELYDQFQSYAISRGLQVISLQEFAVGLEKEGHPCGDGLEINPNKVLATNISLMDLYLYYSSDTGNPEITFEKFSEVYQWVCLFRKETGERGTFKR